jgi:hypothetical protein
LRERVRDDIDAGRPLATKLDNLYRDLQGVFSIIDEGEDAVGIPAYNGGLFDRARSPILVRSRVPDSVMAPIIDALSRRTEDLLRGWINYRDLSVAHLGGIYERLLEYTLEHEVAPKDTFENTPEIDRIVARPASFARKVSGSYYTHDDLVRLILRESVGLLASERIDSFATRIERWKKKTALNPADWDALDKLDPASAILELKICDPAMGSGHFLVALVDDSGRPRAGSDQHRRASGERAAVGRASRRAGPALAKPAGGAHRPHPPHHQGRGTRARLGRDRRSARRPPRRAAHDSQEKRLRRRQEPDGRRTGENGACGCIPSPSARPCPSSITT